MNRSHFDNKHNVDATEIQKFSSISDEWWQPNGKFKPLHIINPLRIEYIIKNSVSLINKNILDVGCGGGILSEALAKQGANVVGLDMAEESLQVARNHALDNNLPIKYIYGSVEEYAITNPQQYDIITCMEMLEHVPEPSSIIHACSKLLKPGGQLYLSTINRTNKSRLMLIIGAEYIARLVPIGTHNFNKFIRPSELMHWVIQANLTTQDIIGIEYNILKNKFYLGNNVDTNYILLAKK